MVDHPDPDLDGSAAEVEKQRRLRSPSYPFVSLRKAVERAKSFEVNHKRYPTRVSAAAETWGYGTKSSGAQQTISALKAFGLLEDVAGPGDRKVKLTDLAYRILHDSRPGVREAAIAEAAKRPKLFRECAEKWAADVPSDAHRVSELKIDRGFTDEAARNFIKTYDDTMSMVVRDEVAKSPSPESDIDDVGDMSYASGGPEAEWGREDRRSEAPSAGTRATKRAVFPLPEGDVVLDVPQELSQESYEEFVAWIDVMLRRIKRSVR